MRRESLFAIFLIWTIVSGAERHHCLVSTHFCQNETILSFARASEDIIINDSSIVYVNFLSEICGGNFIQIYRRLRVSGVSWVNGIFEGVFCRRTRRQVRNLINEWGRKVVVAHCNIHVVGGRKSMIRLFPIKQISITECRKCTGPISGTIRTFHLYKMKRNIRPQLAYFSVTGCVGQPPSVNGCLTHLAKLPLKYNSRIYCGNPSTEREHGSDSKNNYRYPLAIGAVALAGMAVAAVGVYCICYRGQEMLVTGVVCLLIGGIALAGFPVALGWLAVYGR